MKGDFTRDTFKPENHYQQVLQQQGRVQLDADWNEQSALLARRDALIASDALGLSGGPIAGAAFRVVTTLSDPAGLPAAAYAALRQWLLSQSAGDPGSTQPSARLDAGDFVLMPGRYYAGGVPCELEHPVLFSTQPDLRQEALNAGHYFLYLDVWPRHLTAIDDEQMREPALGGPDTATRVKTVWQVRALKLDPPVDPSNPCAAADLRAVPEYDPAPPLLTADAHREASSNDPCIVPPTAAYTGLENQLYRVEIHEAGAAVKEAAAGSGVAVTLPKAGEARNQILVPNPGAWKTGQTVEVFAGRRDAGTHKRQVACITHKRGQKLKLNMDLRGFDSGDQPRLRATGATWKWSRENGCICSRIEKIDGDELTVASLGPAANRGFAAQDLVEILDDELELTHQPGQIAKIKEVNESTRVIVLESAVDRLADTPNGVDPRRQPKIRRWEGLAPVTWTDDPDPAQGWLPLESGIQVRFAAGNYRTGQYWQIPARAATARSESGDIEWPTDSNRQRLPQPPRGIHHHLAPLGIVTIGSPSGNNPSGVTAYYDCRCLFPPLAQVRLYAVGGDGQETMPFPAQPFAPLPHPLQVRVGEARCPAHGSRVLFVLGDDANGRLVANGAESQREASYDNRISLIVATDAQGLAECHWELDATQWHDPAKWTQTAEAWLLNPGGSRLHTPIVFRAALSVACQVAYRPGGWCGAVQGAYYRGPGFKNFDPDELRFIREDAAIDFDWGTNGPDPTNPAAAANQFSVRWTGTFRPSYSEAYTLHVLCDDGVRLWLDDKLLIDQWHDHGPTEYASDPVELQVDRAYYLRLEYYENQGGAIVRLSWSSPHTPKATLPADRATVQPVSVQRALDQLYRQRSLAYVGGGGQEAPLQPVETRATLPAPLRVRVTRGPWPFAGARVQFRLCDGAHGELRSGSAIATFEEKSRQVRLEVLTDADGFASCVWALDATRWNDARLWSQQAEAWLIDTESNRPLGPLTFEGRLSLARFTGCESHGIWGEYYGDAKFAVKRFERLDGRIDFRWIEGSPFSDDPDTPFGVRWTGTLRAERTGVHAFYPLASGRVRLSLGGKGLVDSAHTEAGPTEAVTIISLPRGQSWITNPYVLGDNTVREVLRRALDGTVLSKFARGAYLPPNAFDEESGGWSDGSMQLSPGEGVAVYSPAAQDFIFRGTLPVEPSTPATRRPRGWRLTGCRQPAPSAFEEFTGLTPAAGDRVVLPAWGSQELTVPGDGGQEYRYDGTVWQPNPPLLQPGQAAWVLLADFPPAIELALPPGCSWIANNYLLGENTVVGILGEVLEGTLLYKFSNGAYESINRFEFGEWSSPRMRLLPGEGFVIRNPAAQTVRFRGELPEEPLPVRPRPEAGWHLVGGPLPAPGRFEEVLGFPPVAGDRVIIPDRGVLALGSPEDAGPEFRFDGARWQPGVPVLQPGHAAWVQLVAWPTEIRLSLPAGFAWVANNLASGGEPVSTLPEEVLEGTVLYRHVSGHFEEANTFEGGAWGNPGMRLRLGEGVAIRSPAPQTVVLRGAVPPSPPPVASRKPPGWYLVGGRTPAASSFEDFMGFAPAPGDRVVLPAWGGSHASPADSGGEETVFDGATWQPSVPLLQPGRAAWVWLMPLPLQATQWLLAGTAYALRYEFATDGDEQPDGGVGGSGTFEATEPDLAPTDASSGVPDRIVQLAWSGPTMARQAIPCRCLSTLATVQEVLDRWAARLGLHAAGGNGQITTPGTLLPQPLEVVVTDACGPVSGILIRFAITRGDGRLLPPATVLTDAAGRASCRWTLGVSPETQEVEARIEDASRLSGARAAIRFDAHLRPGGVAETANHVIEVRLVAPDGAPERRIQTGDDVWFSVSGEGVRPTQLAALRLVCDADFEETRVNDSGTFDDRSQEVPRGQPNCFVTLEVPVPLNPDDRALWGTTELVAYHPVVLAASVRRPQARQILWTPAPATLERLVPLLASLETHAWRLGDRMLARLTLKQAVIWSTSDTTNGCAGADYTHWFWLRFGHPPAITRQPESQTVPAGSEVTLVVEATSHPLPSFQWLKNGIPVPGNPTAASNRLTLPRVTPADQGDYLVEVSNALDKVTSRVAHLAVATGSFVVSLTPTEGATDVAPTTPIQAVLEEGVATSLDPASVSMQLDGVRVQSSVVPTGASWTIRYAEGPLGPGSHRVTVSWRDSAGIVGSVTWSFAVASRPSVPPKIVSATVPPSLEAVIVTFSKPLDPTTAMTVANYTISGGVPVLSATLGAGAPDNVVTLRTTRMQPGLSLTLTVNNVMDLEGNTIAPNSTVAFITLTVPIPPIPPPG